MLHPTWPWLSLLGALSFGFDCAPRAVLCDRPGSCGPTAACVANLCQPAGSPPALVKARRFVLEATEVAFIERRSALGPGELPTTATLGRTGSAPAAILLRFDVPRDVEVIAAYLLVDRDEHSDAEGVGLHAERIIGQWDARTVTWLAGPELRDVRGPSLVLRRGAPARSRIDVRPLLVRVPGGESPDQGIALLADRSTSEGASIVLVPELSSPLAGEPDEAGDPGSTPLLAPRLELYVK